MSVGQCLTGRARGSILAPPKGTIKMNKNTKLLLAASSVAVLAISALQGCSSGSDNGTSTPAAGAGAPGAAGAGVGGAIGGAPAITAGTGGAAAGAFATAGTGGATAGTGGLGGATAGTGGATAGTGGTGGDGSGGLGGTGGGTAGAPSAACSSFCTEEGTVCMFSGANAAYASSDACLAACATFTPGTGNSGNTLSCRQYHLDNAKNVGPVATHCPHTAAVSHNAGSAADATDGPCN